MKPIESISEKKWLGIISILSIIVVGLVAFMLFRSREITSVDESIYVIPKLNAILNSMTFLTLITGFVFILRKNIRWHKTFMIMAFVFSSIFLINYVIYHQQAPHTPFGGEGFIRNIYFFLLITHIILAAGIVPLALITVFRALKVDYKKHKRIARWTLPIWLYVSLSGVLIYLLIAPYYPN